MARQNGRVAMMLMASGLCGVAALTILFQTVAAYERRLELATAAPELTYAIVAARDLMPGVPIREEDVFALQIEPKYVHEGVVGSPELVVGRVPYERVLANELIRDDRLADPNTGVGIAGTLPRGMRAISINVSDGKALSGFLAPGDYVDVLVTVHPDDGDRTARTVTVLEVVAVLAVNDRTTEEPAADGEPTRSRLRPSVTLAVTPDDAEAVAHASRVGTITLTLRNRDDAAHGTANGTDWRDILDEPVAPGKPAPRPVKEPEAPKGEWMRLCKGLTCTDVFIPAEEPAPTHR